MKKILLVAILTIATCCYATAQDTIAGIPVSKDVINARQCTVAPVTHWSVGVKIGANYFRVAPEPVRRIDQIHLMYGGTVEYSFSPLVGMGLEYNYNDFTRPYYIFPDKSTIYNDLKGGSHEAILYGNINLSNLLAPYRSTAFGKRLNVFMLGGFGYALYKNPLDQTDPTLWYLGPMANFGINNEYNLSKSFALALEGQYRQYHRKLVSGVKVENSNNLTLTIGLRYKFNAIGDVQHARNISMCDYYPRPEPLIIEKIVKNDTTGAMGRIKDLEKKIDDLKNDLQNKNSDLRKSLIDPNANGNGNSTKAQKLTEEIASFKDIEFEFDSDKLRESSFETLDKIAEILLNNPESVRLGVTGHTDYIGTDEYNQNLSLRRANSVRNYLLAKKVPASNIYIIGCGKEKPIATNATSEGRQKNRRAEFKVTTM